MTQNYLMGLDLGGGGMRCLLIDPADGRSFLGQRALAPQPAPGTAGGMEYEPDAVLAAVSASIRDALARAEAGPDQVIAIAVTSMRHGSALIDADGQTLALTPNRDARGIGAAIQLAASRGAELHRRTGHWPNPVQPAGRLRWFAEQRPELFARVATACALSDWLAFELCGERASEATQASESLLFEHEQRDWAWDLIESLGLPKAIFPALRAPGSRLGALTDAAAARFGLRAGTPVGVGGGDTQCGLLGQGVVTADAIGIVGGSTAPVLQLSAKPCRDAEGRLWAGHHLIEGLWGLESSAGAAGEALEWIAGLLFAERAHPILHLLSEAAQAPVGSAGLVSTLGAEVMNARELGLPIGNLTLNAMTSAGDPQRRRHLARSIVEGMAYALRANIEQLEAVTGARAPILRFGGGLSRSRLLGELLATVSGRSVEVPALHASTALGAAICAGVAAGVFPDLAAGSRALVRIGRTHAPDAAQQPVYDEMYGRWNELRRASKESDTIASGFAIRALAGFGAAAGAAQDGFRPRILVTADLDEAGLAALRAIGDVDYQSFRTSMRLLAGSALKKALAGVHVLVTEVDVVDAASLLEAHDLRAIGCCRGDAVNVDIEACTALGIPVLNTPGRNADAVADLTLAFLLMLARKLAEANAFLRQPGGEAGDMGRMGQAFGLLQGRELWQKTVGLVGLGAVGRKVAERLAPFGARCLVFDPYLDPDAARVAGAEPVELDELLARSDFVSLHAPVTDETRGMIGREQIARMKPGACLVNTARAALLDEGALLAALEAGQLAGAALDVFAVEPPAADHPLLRLPNVLATPHVGGNTQEVAAHQGRIIADELARLSRGERPRHALNPRVLEGYRFAQPRPQPDPALLGQLGKRKGPAVTDLQRENKSPATPAAAPAPAGPAASAPAASGVLSPEAQAIAARMNAILAGFVEAIRGDAALAAIAQSGEEVLLHFSLVDLGSDFHFGFAAGSVVGGLGAPSGAAEVQLKLAADLLDGMFTGRSNPMQAAMNGKLSFSGDTAKAMTLSTLQGDLGRLYSAVRARLGDPGDLTQLAAPAAAPVPSAAPTPAAGAVSGQEIGPRRRVSSVPPGDIRHQLCDIVDELYASQLITATGGNVSVRCTDDLQQAWITPSQLFKGDLAPEILVRIGMDGRALEAGARSPSSEALMHTAVLVAKPEAQAVIHCHAPHATILANAGLPFLPISTEAAFFQNIGRIPFVMPGTRELADAIVAAMGSGWAVLMQNHGLLVAGRTLRRAADMAEIIDRTAEVILGCYAVGREPPVLPEAIVRKLSKMGDLMA